jgi:hypothetical protein
MVHVRRVTVAFAKGKRTTLDINEVQERRNILYRRIESWRQIQSVYMPAAVELLAADPQATSSSAEHPESMPLLLPSQIPATHWPTGTLAGMERRLRIAQADDALCELRRLLRITMGLWDYKYTQLGPGQSAGTRARTMISRFRDKINRCSERYRAARLALLKLDPTGSWISRFKVLSPEDIRAPGRQDDDDGNDRESEGRREIPWIWMGSYDKEGSNQASEEEIGQCEYLAFTDWCIAHYLCCRLTG